MSANGFRPIWRDKDVEQVFERLGDRADNAAQKLLQRTGEEFVKYARLKGNYQDHTGNLRSSIGYAVIKDGKPMVSNVQKSGKGTDRSTGMEEATRLIQDLAAVYTNGYVLVGFAGMRYALYVEGHKNLDVISGASLRAEDFIRTTSRILFEKLSKQQ